MMNNTPKLRFKEFSGDWESNKLENISTKIGDGIHTTPSYIDSSEIKFINGNNIKNHKIVINENTKSISEEELKKYSIYLDNHSILMSINGTIGNVGYYNNEKVLLGKSVAYINVNPKAINKLFLGTLLETDKVQQRFMSELTGSTIKNLSLKSIRECKLSLPSIEEQEKIASLFSLIDDKISLQSEKLEMLKDYNKGMIQKIFSRELRFKDDEGRDYPEWEEKKLAELLKSVSSGKTKSKNEIGEYKVYGSMGVIGYTDEKDYIGKHILIARVGANAGTVNIIDEPCGISDNTLAVKCNKDIDCKFLYYKLKQYNLSRLVFGSGQPLITGGQVKSITINVPNIDEQLKIARYMDIIEMKILKEQEKLDSLNEYKKGLLQQMFV